MKVFVKMIFKINGGLTFCSSEVYVPNRYDAAVVAHKAAIDKMRTFIGGYGN